MNISVRGVVSCVLLFGLTVWVTRLLQVRPVRFLCDSKECWLPGMWMRKVYIA